MVASIYKLKPIINSKLNNKKSSVDAENNIELDEANVLNDDAQTDEYNLAEIKEAPAEVIDEAYSIVKNSLDAITIVQQINVLKFISHFILREYHTKLVPLVALNIDLRHNNKYI